MSPSPSSALAPTRPGPRCCSALCAFVAASALLALCGWIFNIPWLTDWLSTGISQMPNNAVAVLAAGIGLFLLHGGRAKSAAALGAFAALIGGATLFEHLAEIDLGIDRLLIEREWGQNKTTAPGRMGIPASTALTGVGVSIVLAALTRFRGALIAGGLLTGAIALLSVIGYLFGADPLFTIPKYTAISPQTSILLLALAGGLVTCHRDTGFLKVLEGESSAGLLARRALPGVIVVPLLLGWLTVKGLEAQLFDVAFAVALLVLGLIALLCGLLWWSLAAVRQHERALHRKKEELAEILGSITDAFLTFDAEWKVVFVNEQVERRTGKKQEELVGRNFRELFPDRVQSEAYRQLQGAMDERRSTGYEVFDSGQQKWYAERAYPTPEGGLALYSQDITERKIAVTRLLASEARMQLAMTIAEAGTWDLNLTTGVNHWSDSHFIMLGYEPPPDGLATESMWRNAVLAEDLPGVIQESGRASAENDLFRSEHRLQRRDTGDITWVKSAGKFFYDGNGKAVRFVGVFFDITAQKRSEEELKRLAEELRKADQRKDEFLATLAHELRNPLAPVLNSVEVLKSLGGESQTLASARSMIERQIGQMVRLIDDLLDIGRINRNKLELRIEPVNLAAILQQAVEAAEPMMRQAGHDLVTRLPAGNLLLQVDCVRLCQIFGNLLTNACKYTEAGGKIELEVVEEEAAVAVSVKDNGMGIPPEMIDGIFEPFAQVDRSLERSQGGLGIGLTLVKRLVELHGGEVGAASGGRGRGSVFTVRLPRPPELRNTRPPPLPVEARSAPSPRRVLVVDDNVDSARSLAMLLEMSGHAVATANDGPEAVRRAGESQPELILLDIGMPGMSGYEVCRAIRQSPGGTRPKIFALTGWGMEEDRRKSSAAGFDGHLVKPVAPAILLEMVGSLGCPAPNETAEAD